jgi:Xaa-Pro aminopeptidase
MGREGVDVCIVTKFDRHQSENASERWNRVKELTGFTGSAGVAVVTMEKAGLWTDGRYYEQAEREAPFFTLHKAAEQGAEDYISFAVNETPANGAAAFDGRTFHASEAKSLERKLSLKNARIVCDFDPGADPDTGEARNNEDCALNAKLFDFSVEFCGESRVEKIMKLRRMCKENDVDVYVLASLDDIAWLFNLRGTDAPTFEAFALIYADETLLFAPSEKARDVKDTLSKDGVTLRDYDEFTRFLSDAPKNGARARVNMDVLSYRDYLAMDGFSIVEETDDYTALMKAVKNDTELSNLEKAHERDGAAVARLIKWVKENAGNGITEADVVDKALELRRRCENFHSESFPTIAAYMANAAMMHYSPVKGDCATLKPEGTLLIDSGGHYYDGTTDITRTIALGEISPRERRDFTLTLIAHIEMACATFLSGATGACLDAFARRVMWENFIDYKSGTGHGIGFFLNVHEGPQRLSITKSDAVFQNNMLVTNEPGIYRRGSHGVRTENVMRVTSRATNEFGEFLAFETISYCPIDVSAICADMLSDKHRRWLNEYHKTVREKLSPFMNEDEKRWLCEQTKEI